MPRGAAPDSRALLVALKLAGRWFATRQEGGVGRPRAPGRGRSPRRSTGLGRGCGRRGGWAGSAPARCWWRLGPTIPARDARLAVGDDVGVEYVSRVPRPPLDGLIDDLYFLAG